MKDHKGRTPLYEAVTSHKADIVEVLVADKPDCNTLTSRGMSALHEAVKQGNFRIVELLLKAGANPNIKENQWKTPLHLAAERGWLKIVKLLLNYMTRHQIDIKDRFGYTALFLSCY